MGRGQMVMSFETMNCIARFDSLGIDAYDYPSINRFFDNKMNTDDPEGMTRSVLPFSDGGVPLKSHLSVEGKILQDISLENIMVRFGDRGKVKGPNCRVLHALMFGSPMLLWRHIVMMNTWDTQEVCTRKMIPYVRLISAMILQQNSLPPESLWVSKPVEEFCFASMKRH
ncbi:hypothetical protein HanOQP8_Chr13g0473011 [Helianthus annuus]|nr:hypothetical protein HanIR_Chr13g0626881 [Helianthus annuus]KAJ0662826.1 hypothetical protein HanLR1_Chr13g0474071 [Helianthus annuus]KAJ0670336.1 hypothetical protein HanOQP8_Chr13g0473011 [Helianthus annuus]